MFDFFSGQYAESRIAVLITPVVLVIYFLIRGALSRPKKKAGDDSSSGGTE